MPMKIFDIFSRTTKREFLPIAFYSEYKIMGKSANPKDFPKEFFDNIILMTKRLHKMGIYTEEEIVCFSIPKMLEMLELKGILSGVSLSTLDTAQVLFGENYAGWRYKNEEESPSSLYLTPLQLAFYHSKKPDNYFLSLTKEGLDLRQNKVSVTNRHDVANNLRKTKGIKLGIKGMAELRAAYHLLFTHLKYQMLLKMNKLGYLSFMENITAHFCPTEDQEGFISYAKQYFALNTEKREEYPLAHDALSFQDFFYTLLVRQSLGITLRKHSFAGIIEWLEKRTNMVFNTQKVCSDHFDLLNHASDILKQKGYYLWLLIKDNLLEETMILLTQEKHLSKIETNLGFELVPFSADLIGRYEEDIRHERKVREVAKEFYNAIGVYDIDNMMMNIIGTKVLDWQLFKNDHLMFFDSDNDIGIEYLLDALLSKHGLSYIVEEKSNDGFTLDEIFFQDHEDVNPYDRVILYAGPIRKKGYLLFSLETGCDMYHFGIIENTPEAKRRLINSLNKVMGCDEFENYVIFDTEEKRLFINLLNDIKWTLGDKNLFTEREVRETFYKENSDVMTPQQADQYLSRISLVKPEIAICIEDPDGKEVDIIIKAENGVHFTNSNLLLQLHQKIFNNKDFRDLFMESKTVTFGLRLSINREKYYLYYDCSI